MGICKEKKFCFQKKVASEKDIRIRGGLKNLNQSLSLVLSYASINERNRSYEKVHSKRCNHSQIKLCFNQIKSVLNTRAFLIQRDTNDITPPPPLIWALKK